MAHPIRMLETFERVHARVPLAWRNCTTDRRRLMRAVIGIGVAALLIFMQLGFRDAFLASALTIVHAFDGDLVLISPTRYQVGQSEQIPRRRLSQARGVAGVESVSPVYFEWRKGRWRSPADGRALVVRTVAIDPELPALRIPGLMPYLEQLKLPNTAVMDSRGRRHLGEIVPGLESELARRKVSIVGTFPMGPDFVTDGTIIISERTFFTFFEDPQSPGRIQETVDLGFVKLRPGADLDRVRDELHRVLPEDTNIMGRDELVDIETSYQASLTPAGPIFGLGSAIGFIVGILIVYQILFTEISDRLPQYATLKAIGYSRLYLLGVVLRQSLIYGLLGFTAALAVSLAAFAAIDALFLIPMQMTPALFGVTLGMMTIMCLAAALIAARRALTADPAEVF